MLLGEQEGLSLSTFPSGRYRFGGGGAPGYMPGSSQLLLESPSHLFDCMDQQV